MCVSRATAASSIHSRRSSSALAVLHLCLTQSKRISSRSGLCQAVCWFKVPGFDVPMLHLLVHDVVQYRAMQSNTIRNRYKQGNVFCVTYTIQRTAWYDC